MIALSTLWQPDEKATLLEVIKQAVDAGIRDFEIGLSRMRYDRDEIMPLLKNNEIRIHSVHNALFQHGVDKVLARGDGVSSPERRVREEAVDEAVRTMDEAASLGADATVFHMGFVDLPQARKRHQEAERLYGYYMLCPENRKIIEDLRLEREKLKKPYLEAALKSMREISARAPQGMKIGVETRYYVYEIPSFQEMSEFISVGANVGYWHDAGHAHVQARFGLQPHEAWFEHYGRALVGTHLHDCLGTTDHQEPGTGEMDFEMLLEKAGGLEVQVLEMMRYLDWNSVRRGAKFLIEKGF